MKQKKSIQKERNTAPCVYTVDLHGIPVTVTRKRMKTMRLRVLSSDRSVHLSIPTCVSNESAMLFLSSKEDFIRKALSELASRPACAPLQYTDGETLMLWGIPYTISVSEGGRRYSLVFDGTTRVAHLSVPCDSSHEKREKCVRDAYRAALDTLLSSVIPKWEAITGFTSASYDIRFMKSRWGSCNTKTRHIRLNLRLAEHPMICTEYVVLHELCHLKIPHHGKEFHALVGSFLPDWHSIRAMLNGNPYK